MGVHNDPREIAQLYDRKTLGHASPLNLALAHPDGLFFNHNGLYEPSLGDLLAVDREADRLKLLHDMEVVLAGVGQRHLGIGPASLVLDAGCGAGGGAIVMHRRYGCDVEGVTLSPEQARFAEQAAEAYGIANHVRFAVGDMSQYAEAGGPFDAVWACESTEHASDLTALFGSFRRALRPGGRVVVIAWCASVGREADVMKQRVDEHYHTDISTVGEYWGAAAAARLAVRECVDLTPDCVPDWQLRARCEGATGSEAFMLPAFASRLLTYKLFVLEA